MNTFHNILIIISFVMLLITGYNLWETKASLDRIDLTLQTMGDTYADHF